MGRFEFDVSLFVYSFMETGQRICYLCYQLFSSKYISRHTNIFPVKNSETSLNVTNERSNNEDNFDIELQT